MEAGWLGETGKVSKSLGSVGAEASVSNFMEMIESVLLAFNKYLF